MVWGMAAEALPSWVLSPLALVGFPLHHCPARGHVAVTVRIVGVLSLAVGIVVAVLV